MPRQCCCPTVNCCNCPAIPRVWRLTFAGLTTGDGSCSACGSWNGTWFLHLLGNGECVYLTDTTTSCPPGFPSPPPVYWEANFWMQCGINPTVGWIVFLGNINLETPLASYAIPSEQFKCLGTNILTYQGDGSLACTNYPATLTITPA